MTAKEWDAKWWEVFKEIRKGYPTLDLQIAQKAANKWMLDHYGPKPAGEHTGPPLWVKLAALAAGVPMGFFNGIWTWLNGKKTVIGAIILALTTVAGYLPSVLDFFGVADLQIAAIVGVVTTVLGILHKLYKWLFNEEPK